MHGTPKSAVGARLTCLRAFRIESEFGSVAVFAERENRKISSRNQQQTLPRPRWWEASALTTAPPLLPRLDSYVQKKFLPLFDPDYHCNRS